jgi:hypothetical protein
VSKSGNDTAMTRETGRKWSWHGGSGAMIWQLMFLESGKVLGIKRFAGLRQASLFCLQPDTGEVLCDDFVPAYGNGSDAPVGEGWMIGLETTHGELLFCHSFQPGSPEHLGLWALDLPGGHVVWSRPDIVFAANLGDSFLVYKSSVFAGFPEREYWLVDPLSGQVLEHLGTGHERPNQLRDSAMSEQSRQGILLPELCLAGPDPVECIRYGLVTVEGYHCMTVEGSSWVSGLRIMTGERALYDDTMALQAPMPLFNNFLIKGTALYYIKESEELISVTMS